MCKYSALKGAPNSNYKTREMGSDASLQLLYFFVSLALYSKLSVFLFIMNTL